MLFGITGGVASLYAKESEHKDAQHKDSQYVWTTDHMQVGVRWQPFVGRPGNNAYDAQRPVIAQDSSYVQFWMAWPALEPTEANKDYVNKPSGYLQTMEQAVDACKRHGIKVEFVFFSLPCLGF